MQSSAFQVGSWVLSREHGEPVRILDAQTVWQHTTYLVWHPGQETVIRVAAESLASLDQSTPPNFDHLIYTVAAARIVEGLAEDVLLAPLEAGAIPLPHQLYALSKALSGDTVRYLLADEVGLGKTIEAGLIMRELKLRGLVKRVLVAAPKGLVAQWVQEMRLHFSEPFQPLSPSDFLSIRHLVGEENLWRHFDQVVCPIDAVKPVEKRRGWSRERLERHNQARIGDLVAAGWDLIIVDEAHRLGGSTDTVARYQLGKALADAAPYLLLLSATPHQGKTESFHRLIALLDQDAFPTIGSIKREKVAPFVIRTEKRKAITSRGTPLFQSRLTKLVPVHWQPRHALQHQLYEAVTAYVRHGYNQAMLERRHYLGFLMLLMQRLVTSSTSAIAAALERRLDVLHATAITPDDVDPEDTDLSEADGQEQLEALLASRIAGLQHEHQEVEVLLEMARRCQAQGPDARAEALLDLLYRTQQEENDPALKFLIFTEFVPTQHMLQMLLVQHGFSTVCLNGSMDLASRQRVQREFSQQARILVSTDAGGEGLNLQFAHVVINYDLPWNPMRIEQRIGRVDRIGQQHPVKAFNMLFADSVELRVHEILEDKLRTIYAEFGVDKTSDVLDSAESGGAFEKVYADAILHPEAIEHNVEQLIQDVRERAAAERQGTSLYEETPLDLTLASRYLNHPMSYWIERMTTAYVRAEGGSVEKTLFAYDLQWPDGERLEQVSFVGRDAQERGLTHLTLEHPKLRTLIEQLPWAVPGEPIPIISMAGLSRHIQGYWSLWQVALRSSSRRVVRVLPLFCHDDGRTLVPTARALWDKCLQPDVQIVQRGMLDGTRTAQVFAHLRGEAEQHGESLFQQLSTHHQDHIRHEWEKGRYAFQVRREALHRIGLPEVRQFRLRRLDEEERAWAADLRRQERILPELQPIIVLRVEPPDG